MPIAHDLISDSKSVPCPVKKYYQRSGHNQALSKLSIEQRQIAFRRWVTYDLYGHSDPRPDNEFKCPLFSCDFISKDRDSCLAHLTNCAWLPTLCYWCPSCDKAEEFADPPLPFRSGLKTGSASRISGFLRSSTQKTLGTVKIAGRPWKHISHKLCFLSRRPETRNKNMDKVRFDYGSLRNQDITFSQRDDALNVKMTTVAAEKPDPSAQYFAPDDFPSAAALFAQEQLHCLPTYHGTMPPLEWRDTPTPVYFELPSKQPTSANDPVDGCDLDPNHLNFIATKTSTRQGRYSVHPWNPQDSTGTPYPFMPGLPDDSYVINPTSNPDTSTNTSGDETFSNTVGPSTDTQTLDEHNSYTYSSHPVLDEICISEWRRRSGAPPVSSLVARLSYASTSPSTPMTPSNRDSFQSSNFSDSTQNTSPEVSPVFPSGQRLLDFTDTPQEAAPQELICPDCPPESPWKVGGSLRDQKSNMNRHRRTRHGSGFMYTCLADDCNKVYNRSDNRMKHCREKHKELNLPMRRSTRRRTTIA